LVSKLTGLLPEQLPKDADTDEIIWHDQAQVSPELAVDKWCVMTFGSATLQHLKLCKLSKTSPLWHSSLPTLSQNTPAAVQNKPKS